MQTKEKRTMESTVLESLAATKHEFPKKAEKNYPSANQSLIYIDVRTPKEFQSVHIPGTRNIPLSELPGYVPELQRLAEEHRLIFVCRTHNRAQQALDYVQAQGITNAAVLDGGVSLWAARETGAKPGHQGMSIEGQVRAITGSLILLGVGLGFLINHWFLLLPALAGIGLIHAGLTDSCLMGNVLSHVPGNRARSFLPAPLQKGGQP